MLAGLLQFTAVRLSNGVSSVKIVLTMAGSGTRFQDCQFSPESQIPKYLMDVAGRPMLMWALESLRGLHFSELVLVALERDRKLIEKNLREVLEISSVAYRGELSDGQLSSALDARSHLRDGEDLLILGCDTYVVSDLGQDIRNRPSNCAGILSVAPMKGERWSFARIDSAGCAVEVAEKRRISDHACTGMYYFSEGRSFLNAADDVLRHGERLKGEFYMIQVYDELIRRGEIVLVSHAQMRDMGTPQALSEFLCDVPDAANDIVTHLSQIKSA